MKPSGGVQEPLKMGRGTPADVVLQSSSQTEPQKAREHAGLLAQIAYGLSKRSGFSFRVLAIIAFRTKTSGPRSSSCRL